jgi:hypothetical protein
LVKCVENPYASVAIRPATTANPDPPGLKSTLPQVRMIMPTTPSASPSHCVRPRLARNQTSPTTNPIAKLTFTGADQGLVSGLRFNSSGNAFEVDNVAVKSTAVPEPATWMMMFVGFAALGRSMRRRHGMRVAFA